MTVHLILVRMEVPVLMVWTVIPVSVWQATMETTVRSTLMNVLAILVKMEGLVLMASTLSVVLCSWIYWTRMSNQYR